MGKRNKYMRLPPFTCFIRSIIDSLRMQSKVSGHTWKDVEEHKNCSVTISKCEDCEKVDISWSKRNI